MKIRYRPAAIAQLDAIFSTIATHNRPAGHRVMTTIKRTIERLGDFPRSARPSEVPGIRELPIVRYPYIQSTMRRRRCTFCVCATRRKTPSATSISP